MSETRKAYEGGPTFFNGLPQHNVLPKFKELFPVTQMPASSNPCPFPTGDPVTPPKQYVYGGQTKDFEAFTLETDTCALLIIKDGQIKFERYFLTGGRDVHWTTFSVAKSFVSALVGIAVHEGQIGSIEEPITDYVRELCGTAYEGVRIKDVLQMSSGARWVEDYSDPNSDIRRLVETVRSNGSLDQFMTTIVRANDPGTYNRYCSADTQALGMLLSSATGVRLADYMHKKIWEPLGMEAPGYWLVDNCGRELAYAGANMVARDFAKLGELYRKRGSWSGVQIVPEAWVDDSTRPDAPHLMPGINDLSDRVFGYGYQWWIPEGHEGEFVAIGVYNQFVFVNPNRGIVIVKLSANRNYGTSMDERTNRLEETIAYLRGFASVVE